ncbi:MAG: hypothetical protein PQJ61_08980 [Spirochaetales bacterium]|uniref:Uncharacterized protein n=1 Tax=Candidatus Thalassospirochaeta sargassi TaxID=3119039 RepID=A0AAJ1IFJ4_9SPIO|nr:hypothetical protein [Spirochaetales bacterium]
MAEIKSALEIALARTEGMEVDKDKMMEKEFKISGRRAALSFLDGKTEADELKKAIKKEKGKARKSFTAGAAGSLMSLIKLPLDSEYKSSFKRAAEGLAALSDHPKDIIQMFEQLSQFFDQYLENRDQLLNQLTLQFQPILQQKEEALYAQTGSKIKIDPMDDPDFQKAFSQNMENISKNYTEALTQAKGQLKEFLALED